MKLSLQNYSDNTDNYIINDQITIGTTLKPNKRKLICLDWRPIELMNYEDKDLINKLTLLYSKLLKTQKIPYYLKRNITFSILEMSDKQKSENYRGMTLLSSIMKLLTPILKTSMNQMLEPVNSG